MDRPRHVVLLGAIPPPYGGVQVNLMGIRAFLRARDRQTKQEVALKLLANIGEENLERFAREAEVIAGLRHPGIVSYVAHGRSEDRRSLRDFFEVDHRYVVVATLVALARDGKLDPAILRQAMQAFNINPDKSDPAKS